MPHKVCRLLTSPVLLCKFTLVLGAWCYTRRFATTIVSTTQGSNVGTTLQPFETTSQQCFNAVRVALKIVPRKIAFTSSIKHEIRLFSRGSLRRTAKNCTKRCDTRAILLFCFSNLLLLWRSRCRHCRLIFRSPLLLWSWHVAIIHHPA